MKYYFIVLIFLLNSCCSVQNREVQPSNKCESSGDAELINATKLRMKKIYLPMFPTSPSLLSYSKGCVKLGFIISKDGIAKNLKILSEHPKGALALNGKKALKQFEFYPSKQEDKGLWIIEFIRED